MAAQDTEDLPRTNVRRIIKTKLTELQQKIGDDDLKKKDFQINKDTLLAFCESAKIFVHYISSTANEICHENKRQTINADDVLTAVEDLDFPEFLEPLCTTLDAFRKENQTKKSEAKGKKPPGKKRKVEDGEEGEQVVGEGPDVPTPLQAPDQEQEEGEEGARMDEEPEPDVHHPEAEKVLPRDAAAAGSGHHEEGGPEHYHEESRKGFVPQSSNRNVEVRGGGVGEEGGGEGSEEYEQERVEEDALLPAESEHALRGSTGAGILHPAQSSHFYGEVGGVTGHIAGGIGGSHMGFPESHFQM